MPVRIKRRRRFRGKSMNPARFERSQLKFYLLLLPVALVMSVPILFIFMNALKPIDELFAYPPRLFVRQPTLQNFVMLFNVSNSFDVPASRYLLNSIVATGVTVILSIYISAAAGYVLSKKRFRAKRRLLELNTLALMFVAVAVAIPRYFVIVYSGLYNTFLAHIIPLLVTPVGVFLVKQFIDQMPDALIEAAVIDGANDFQILRRIVMPLVRPSLATLAILMFQASWNATEASSLYIDNEALKNFAFYMTTLSNTSVNSVAGQGIAAAATCIMFLPNLILFIILQSKVMNTMAYSGIK